MNANPQKDGPEAWYVIRTRSQCEFKAAEQVKALGFDAWSPKHIKRITRRGKRVQRVSALLPGYAFAFLDLAPVIERAVLECRDVMEFLADAGGGRPFPISDFSIRHLRGVEADTNLEKRFSPGDWIMVVDGLRKGNRARILRLDSQGRLQVQEVDSGTVRPYSILRTAVEPVAGVTTTGTRTGSIECAAFA